MKEKGYKQQGRKFKTLNLGCQELKLWRENKKNLEKTTPHEIRSKHTHIQMDRYRYII